MTTASPTWILNVPAQNAYRDGVLVEPTVRSWNFVGFQVAYDSTNRWITIQGGSGSGDWKESVRLRTVAALPAYTFAAGIPATITANVVGALPNIDGQAAAVDDRVLLDSAGTTSDVHNGIWVVTSIGGAGALWSFERDILADETGEITPGLTVRVEEGTVSQLNTYFCTNTGTITMNVTTITFANTVTAIPLVTATVRGTVNPFTATANLVLQGDGVTAGGVWSANVLLGLTPALTGRIRLTSLDGIYERTTAAADAWLIGLDAGDNILVGDGVNNQSIGFDVPAGQAVAMLEAGSELLDVDANGLTIGAAVVTPSIFQADETVGGASDLLTTHSQDNTVAGGTAGDRLDRAGDATGGGASTGGSHDIRPGAGTTNGTLDLQEASGAAALTVVDTGASLLHFAAAGYARLGLVAGSGAGSAAATGGQRMQGNGAVQGRLVFRDDIDAGDLAGMSAIAGNLLYLGGTYPTRPSYIIADAASTVSLRVGAAQHIDVGGTNILFYYDQQFVTGAVTPSIFQIDETGAGVVADLLTLHSQDATSAGAAPTGGGLLVRAGDSTAGNGNGGDYDMRPGAAFGAGTPGTLALQDSTGADVLHVDATGLSTDLAVHHNRTVVNFGMTPYTVLVGDHVLGVTTAGGAVTIDLPPAANHADRHLIVKDEGGLAVGANITIDANGGEFIDGALTAVINANYGAINLYCDGTGWFIY